MATDWGEAQHFLLFGYEDDEYRQATEWEGVINLLSIDSFTSTCPFLELVLTRASAATMNCFHLLAPY